MPHFHSTETLEETGIEGSHLMLIVCYSMTSCVQMICVLVILLKVRGHNDSYSTKKIVFKQINQN